MGLPRRSRLAGRERIRAIYARGRRAGGSLGTVWVLPGEADSSRLALAFPRRLGTAVVRNRGRRRVQECFRALEARFARPWDVVFRAQPGLRTADRAALEEGFAELLRRVGVLE